MSAYTEAAMQAGFNDAKRRAAELSQKAKDAAERARQSAAAAAATTRPDYVAPPPSAVVPPEAAPATPLCPKCTAPVGANDLFCGVCGFKLK